MRKLLVTGAALGVLFVATVTGCKQDVTLTIQSTETIKDTVSFSKELQPIFTAKCALNGCHVNGGQAPDLENGESYSSLSSAKFYNIAAPKSSILYERLTGALAPAMPVNGTNNPDNINALVLAWITQGAKNN